MKLEDAQGNYITSICYFSDVKLIILGLNKGILIALNFKSLEIIFSKKISEFPLRFIQVFEF